MERMAIERAARTIVRSAAALALVVAATGCAGLLPQPGQGARSHPAIQERVRSIRSPGILPPDVKVYSLSTGGVQELRDDWSAAGRDNVLEAVKANLGGQPVVIKPAPTDKEAQEAIADLQSLYAAVSQSILDHTYGYGPDLFVHKLRQFDYSVGPVERLLQRYRVDALVLVHGSDEISSGGRRALQTVGAIIPFAPRPRKGFSGMTLALVDRSGAVLWYEAYGTSGGADFRDRGSVEGFVRRLMGDFPRLGQ